MTSSYLKKQGQNTVNLEGTDPLQFAVLSNLKQVSYKNQLQGQDGAPPKPTDHKVRAFGYTHNKMCLITRKEIFTLFHYQPTNRVWVQISNSNKA